MTSTNKLHALRSRLADLGRRRWLLRAGTAAAALALAVLWTLAVMFLIDWQFELDKPQRVVLILMGLGAIAWAWSRYCRPHLARLESELEMALLVERQQRIDTDLVAALEFETPQAASWGSAQLETAVIDYVAEFGKDLNVYEGLSTRPLMRRAALLAVTVLVLAGLSLAFPGHLSAFLNRLALGSRHYPTRTAIDRIVLNKQTVFASAAAVPVNDKFPSSEVVSGPLKSPYWEPLKFEIHCSGELPTEGRAELESSAGVETSFVLTADPTRPGVYLGQLERLVDSITYQLYLGDAWTDPAEVTVIPPPVVDLDLRVTPPSYAQVSEKQLQAQAGARQVSVVEGSHVAVHIKCDKPLESAVLSVGQKQYPLVRDKRRSRTAGESGRAYDYWMLNSATGTPLAQVVEPLRYELQVHDRDGLELKDPIQGFIRIKADRQPRVTAAVVTQYVLPVAKPSISYGASDDYGVARLRLHRQVVRQSGDMQEDIIDVPKGDVPSGELPQKLVRGQLPVDLSTLKLVKGDQLKITFEAIDYRGSLAGKSALSEPLVLHVTDERGVLAAMVEADERSARQLDAIIQRQLGIGENP